MFFAHGHVPFRYLWEYKISHIKHPILRNSWCYLDLLSTSGSFISIVIPSCLRYKYFVSLWWVAWILLTADTRSTYDPSPNVHNRDSCKTIAAPVLKKNGLAITCLSCHFLFNVFHFHSLQDMAHGWLVGSRQMGRSKVRKKGCQFHLSDPGS